MKIYDLDLKRIRQAPDKELGEYFWDFTQTTFVSRLESNLNYWYVQKDEEMRIDLICNRIYSSSDYVDILLNINKIDNPLNIKAGDIIQYPNSSDISLYRYREDEVGSVQRLLSRNKAPRKDNTRKKYIEQNYSLPPTVLQSPVNPVNIVGDNIIVGGGLLPS